MGNLGLGARSGRKWGPIQKTHHQVVTAGREGGCKGSGDLRTGKVPFRCRGQGKCGVLTMKTRSCVAGGGARKREKRRKSQRVC